MADAVRISGLRYTTEDGLELLSIDVCAIRSGSFTVLGGPNGAGKSLLARHLAGLNESADSALWLAGPVALVMQEPEHQILGATVADDLGLGLRMAGAGQEEVAARVRDAAESAGLRDRLDSPPEELSGGERRRLAIATALLARRPILVCDEPWSFLDYRAGMDVLKMLLSAKRAGTTVIVMTHDLQWILHTADRLLLLERGQISADLALPPTEEHWPGEDAAHPGSGSSTGAVLPPLTALQALGRHIAAESANTA